MGRALADHCVQIRGPGVPALQLAVKLTRWKMIANLELWPHYDEELPSEVTHARDRSLREAAH